MLGLAKEAFKVLISLLKIADPFYILSNEMNGYELSRKFFDWTFENPELIKPIHSAIYFFAIEHCNRLGWKKKFGLPSQMVMDAIGVKNWRTYSKALKELVDWGFVEMIEVSKNQYSSNIIAIVKNTKAQSKAQSKALDRALQKHSAKHSQSTVSIDKQLNNKTINNKTIDIPPFLDFLIHAVSKEPHISEHHLKLKYDSWIENGWKDGNDKKITNWKSKLTNTVAYIAKGTNSITPRKVKVFG